MTFISHLLADYQFSSDEMQAKESSKNNYMDCSIIEGDNLLLLPCHLNESSDMAWNTKLCDDPMAWWKSEHSLKQIYDAGLFVLEVVTATGLCHWLNVDTGDYGFFPLSSPSYNCYPMYVLRNGIKMN